MPKGTNVQGFELTKAGMKSMFAQMGYPDVTTGTCFNKNATIDQSKLESQGFMPIQAVSLGNSTAHWLMLIKGKEGHYHLYDPMGTATGSKYLEEIKAKLPMGATLDVIPTEPGLHAGLSGYW